MSITGKGKGMKEYNEKVTLKDTYIQGYCQFRHAWGADSKAFFDQLKLGFTGIYGDYIYHNLQGVSK